MQAVVQTMSAAHDVATAMYTDLTVTMHTKAEELTSPFGLWFLDPKRPFICAFGIKSKTYLFLIRYTD